MVDDTEDRIPPDPAASPLPIPELDEPAGGPADPPDHRPAGPAPEVTDDDRQTYGRLLDSAMERGLLSPYDYETRLGDLAVASTIDEMKTIVTELPIFTSSTPTKARKPSLFPGSRPSDPDDDLPLVVGSARARMSGAAARGRPNRWTKLIVLLIAVIVLFVALSIYAAHVANSHNNHSGAPPTRTTVVFRPGSPAGVTTLRL
ncbi:MAG TPA: DUF1707 domain-containing protein [Acidimicrobiales bacterium]|nr:DUF1707 domain-containing protein [Acidimicrobiales bacterium]